MTCTGMRSVRFGVALLLGGTVAAGACTRDAREDPPSVAPTVVAVLPLTGDLAALGNPKREAIQLALDDLRRENPGTAFDVKFQDSRGNPTDGISALRQGATLNNAKVAFVDLTPVVAASVPVADELGVLTFAGSAQAGITQRSTSMFRVFPGGDQEVQLIGDHLRSTGVKTLFIIHTNELYGRSVNDLIRAQAPSWGVNVVGNDEYALSDSDFRLQLTKARESGAEKIALMGYGTKYEVILSQARELGLPATRFVANLGAVNATMLALPAELTEGLVFAGPAFAYRAAHPDSFPRVAEFTQRYRQRFNRNPDFRVAFIYDTFMLLANSWQGVTTVDSLRSRLARVNGYDGVSGRISMNENRDATVEMMLAEYRGGKVVPWRAPAPNAVAAAPAR